MLAFGALRCVAIRQKAFPHIGAAGRDRCEASRVERRLARDQLAARRARCNDVQPFTPVHVAAASTNEQRPKIAAVAGGNSLTL